MVGVRRGVAGGVGDAVAIVAPITRQQLPPTAGPPGARIELDSRGAADARRRAAKELRNPSRERCSRWR